MAFPQDSYKHTGSKRTRFSALSDYNEMGDSVEGLCSTVGTGAAADDGSVEARLDRMETTYGLGGAGLHVGLQAISTDGGTVDVTARILRVGTKAIFNFSATGDIAETGLGGIDDGISAGNGESLAMWVAAKSDQAAYGVFFSRSFTPGGLDTTDASFDGYDLFERIGSIYTNSASAAVIAFMQEGDDVWYLGSDSDLTFDGPDETDTSAATFSVPVVPEIARRVYLRMKIASTSSALGGILYRMTGLSTSGLSIQGFDEAANTQAEATHGFRWLVMSASQQIDLWCSTAPGTSLNTYCRVFGYKENFKQ